NLAFGGPYQTGIVFRRFEERKNIGAIVARNAAQGADGSAHLATLERAEKSHGDSRGARDLREGKVAALAQVPNTQARRGSILRRSRNYTLALEDVNDCRRIQAARAAEKDGALQKAHVFLTVDPVTAARAMWGDETERFPRAQRGRRNTY